MDPNECGTPRPVGGEAPKGREDAVHGGVFAAALLVGELESDVVDESQPEWRKSPGEGDEREDLGEDCRTSKTGGGGGGTQAHLAKPLHTDLSCLSCCAADG